jgi:nitrous oxidase accessory protein NosD
MKWILVLLIVPVLKATSAEHLVSSAADVARVSAEAKPGDVLVMSVGEWKDQTIAFRGNGTAEKPITLRAQTAGKVILIGKSSVTIEGEHLVVSGLFLRDGQATGDGVRLAGRNNRLTEKRRCWRRLQVLRPPARHLEPGGPLLSRRKD